jgi:endonuclease YncB( thermonuclease family)
VEDLMVNAELVRLGYAHAMTVPPNVAHASRFVSLERQAREAGLGLWGHAGERAIRGHLLRWRARPGAQRTESTPRARRAPFPPWTTLPERRWRVIPC